MAQDAPVAPPEGAAAEGTAGPESVGEASWLASQLSQWYAGAARVAPGTWGIAVADQSGKILWEVNKDRPLTPASTVKLLTTGFARSVLGGDARRPTRVVGTGRLDPATGAWLGTWSLQVNGDVTLERAEGSGPTLFDLAQQLRTAGVRRLSGPFQVTSADGPAVDAYPSVWSARHRGRLFAPPIGPVAINENVVWMTIAPGAKVGSRARLVAASPDGVSSLVSVKATTRRGRRTDLRLLARKDGGWVVTGHVGVRGGPRRLTAVAANPKAVLEAAWTTALRRAGIAWTPKSVAAPKHAAEPRVLAEVTSPPFDSVASEVNRRSLNIGAELLLRWAAGPSNAAAQLADHVRTVTGDPEAAHLVDGSGLSGEDRVKPSAFIAYLAKFPTLPAGRNFPQLLPANGTGTLRRLNSGFPGSGVVRAKTGTLNNVSTVVGYLGRPEGTLLVSLMYNGSRPWMARQEQWKLFRVLGADGVVIPSDTTEAPDAQLGGDGDPVSAPPKWWPTPADSASASH
ncbi:MAG TPA: D-alanyl-D-alanine carboxypeptidase/D-alanyl-D-alanine-endopeptidase [Gemmatimonadales bacterium]|nr:D-alanyl-D-alanine carboxypeptidase/D-alanyl-D-alanine-endopeptidase [Gemmatimonadales bacterium]